MKKKVGKGERVRNIVQLRGASMKKKLEYDHIENSLTFEDVLTKKRVTVKLLEGYLDQADYDDCKSMDINTHVIVDFDSMIRKLSFRKILKNQ